MHGSDMIVAPLLNWSPLRRSFTFTLVFMLDYFLAVASPLNPPRELISTVSAPLLIRTVEYFLPFIEIGFSLSYFQPSVASLATVFSCDFVMSILWLSDSEFTFLFSTQSVYGPTHELCFRHRPTLPFRLHFYHFRHPFLRFPPNSCGGRIHVFLCLPAHALYCLNVTLSNVQKREKSSNYREKLCLFEKK